MVLIKNNYVVLFIKFNNNEIIVYLYIQLYLRGIFEITFQ